MHQNIFSPKTLASIMEANLKEQLIPTEVQDSYKTETPILKQIPEDCRSKAVKRLAHQLPTQQNGRIWYHFSLGPKPIETTKIYLTD